MNFAIETIMQKSLHRLMFVGQTGSPLFASRESELLWR
jgi:hypothetical protein